MEARKDIAFDVLSDEEAWNLFREMVGDVVDNANLHDIAKEVAKECRGLPIAILTLGKALAKREKSEWENAVLELKKCIRVQEKVQSSITLSYNFLGSLCPQAQPLLLLCCLFLKNENIPIEQLVKYSMGLKLFDDVATFEETRNKVYNLINLLKNCNLLLDGDQSGENGDVCVKVHDIVLDACLFIASNSQHSYLVRHEQNLKLWPEDNRWKTLTAVVLTSDVMDKLPAGLDYPNLRLLQLQLKSENIDISEDFFQGMKALNVFGFQGDTNKYGRKKVGFAPLPPSLQSLSTLRALSLEFCKMGEDIFIIGCLKRLEVLSFFKSYLDKLPNELRELRNLKLLDLRCDNADLKIGENVLSSLENLEVLYMGKYESWTSNEEDGKKNARVTELELLSCLTTLQIKVPNSRILLQLTDLFFEKLKRFEISIDWGSYCCGRNGIVRNSLCLGDVDLSLLSETKMHSIVGSTQCLELEGCDEVEFIIDALDLARGVFHKLESLVIEEMSNLIEICRGGTIPDGSFHRLQKLRLAMLPSLRHLWRGPLQPPSLINLRVLDMSDCHVIESLFSPSVAKCLMQLEELKIGFCFEVEGVICSEGREDDESIGKIQFPKLSYLWLDHLPKLKSFYLESSTENVEHDDCGTTLPLFNQQVSFPRLDKLEIQDLNILKQIVDCQLQEIPGNKLRVLVVVNCEKLINLLNSTAMLQNLEEVVVDNCESVEAVFDLEGPKAVGEPAPSFVYKLETIQLIELPRLTHVWSISKGIQGFQNLKTISIYYCHELRYLVSASMAKVLVNLQVLNLAWCYGMVGVIEGEYKDGCGELESTDNIVFHQLQVLRLEYLSSFTSFSSSTHDLEFPLLDNIKIKGCPNMKIFCRKVVSTPILKDPVEDSDGKQWIWEGNLNNGFYREKREEKEVGKEEVEVENKDEINSNDRTKISK